MVEISGAVQPAESEERRAVTTVHTIDLTAAEPPRTRARRAVVACLSKYILGIDR